MPVALLSVFEEILLRGNDFLIVDPNHLEVLPLDPLISLQVLLQDLLLLRAESLLERKSLLVTHL